MEKRKHTNNLVLRLSPTALTQIPDAFHGMGYAHYKVQAPKISLLQERTQKFSLPAAPHSPPRPARLHPLGGRGTSPATSARPMSSKQRNLAGAALRRARSSADVPMAAPPSPTGAVGHMTAAFTSPEEKSIVPAAEPDRSVVRKGSAPWLPICQVSGDSGQAARRRGGAGII